MRYVSHILIGSVKGTDFYFKFLKETIEAFGYLKIINSNGLAPETQEFLDSCGYSWYKWSDKDYMLYKGKSLWNVIRSGVCNSLLLISEEEWNETTLERLSTGNEVVEVKREDGYWVVIEEK